MVSLDLETTGLDQRSDMIIEIGAVKFRGNEEIEQFSALINPGRDIPPFIRDLTGISNDDVADAPSIESILPDLIEFLGDHPMIGHNVAFDAGFLVRNGVPSRTQTFDTYDLTYALLPGAVEYNLGGLGMAFGLVHDNPHRALSDALVTRDLFLLMLDKLAELPAGVLSEFSRLAAASGWTTGILAGRTLDHMDSAAVFQAAGEARPDPRELGDRLRVRRSSRGASDPEEFEELEEIEQAEKTVEPEGFENNPPDGGGASVSDVFRADGHLSRELAGFEHRSQQERMAEMVAGAIEEGEHLIVEAGTGVGKSLAYL
ncbi:MAG TPA: hypothetical protein EYG13_06505, partial [Dehalococcoidia bacterium]|nr:hypothetical protein [Dehalococcoidia bacterium]